MILTPILGAMAFNQLNRGEKAPWDREGALDGGHRDGCGMGRDCVGVHQVLRKGSCFER